jgi:sugar phosphate isomerase/epimerase
MRLFARPQPLARYPILECLGVIQRLGFDGVEVCLENEDIRPDLLDDALIAQVRERVETLGLVPFSISYHKDYIYDDEMMDKTLTAIRRTPQFGTDILVFSGTRPRAGDQAAWERMLERTRALVKVAEECGVVLAQEFEPGFIVGSTADLLRLFEAIPSPSLAANLDLGHVFLCDPDPVQAIHDLNVKIVHAHVEGMKRGVHEHLLPQEGDMDLGLYLRALADVGFQGGIALDLYKNDYEGVAPGVLAYIRQLMP